MKNKKLGIGFIILGLVLIVVDFLAVPLGFANAGFGWKQITLLAVGLIIFLAGLFMALYKSKK